jgi:hypothetical protein
MCVETAKCRDIDGVDATTRCYPNRRPSAVITLLSKSASFEFRSQADGDVLMHPIFVDTTNASYNETFNRSYAVHDCPTGACDDAHTGKRFWGFVELTSPVQIRR